MAKRKKKVTADDIAMEPIIQSTDLPTDPVILEEYNLKLFNRTVANNPFIPIIRPTLNEDGTFKVDERTGRPMHGRPSPRQVAFLSYFGRDALYGGAAGGGKQIPICTPLPTPRGWLTIGQVIPGDELFDEEGKPCKVTAIYGTENSPESYKLIFDDGTEQVACADHKWLTFDKKELGSLTRRDDGWRARRRKKRLSRVSGNKSETFTASIIARNKANSPAVKEPPSGTIRTTKEIFETQQNWRGAVNHAIPIAKPLELLTKDFCLDPYLLGLWLGDGTTLAGSITTADKEILEAFTEFKQTYAYNRGKASTYGFIGLRQRLKLIGVFGDKHIPLDYLRGSKEQRLALLQGLMDTDGCACHSGAVEFTTTKQKLAAGVYELIVSLGWKARVAEGRATLYGKDCGAKYRINWTPSEHVFRLPRKSDKQKLASRRTTKFRYIVRVERAWPEPMRCISVDSPRGIFLCGRSMVPTHNSDALLMCALQFVEVPGYSAIIFRRTLKMLEKAGGLIPRMLEWLAGKGAKYNHTDRRWTFPSGATIEFGYIDTKKDFENYQGGAWQTVCFDEAGQMAPEYITYLFSRQRKPEGSQIPIRMRLGSNPGGTGHEFLKRRYVMPGAPQFFVPSLAKDNPGIDVADYVKSLSNLDPILRAQLLEGDWSAYEGGRFKKAWFKEFYAQKGRDGQPRYFLQIGKDKFTQSPVFHEYGILVRDCFNCITVDPACTEDDSNCPTAIGVYAITPDRELLILEVVRKWLDIDDICPEIARLCERYQPSWVGIEDAGAFSAVTSAARKNPRIPAVKSISHESKSKLVRATPAIIRTEAGQVYTPPAGPRFSWVEDFISECIQFTGDEEQDAYTDQVDQFGHLVRTIDRMGLGGAAVVFRDQDKALEMEANKQITFLIDKGDGSKIEGDEWDQEEVRDEPSRTYGGMIGWRR